MICCLVATLIYTFYLHLCHLLRRGLYYLLTMTNAGGTRTCVHHHLSRLLYHWAITHGSIKRTIKYMLSLSQKNYDLPVHLKFIEQPFIFTSERFRAFIKTPFCVFQVTQLGSYDHY